MKYLLDTETISYLIKNTNDIRSKLELHKNEELFISAITLAELEYGAFVSSKPGYYNVAIARILSHIKVLPFDDSAAVEYGKIRAELKKKGNMIGYH